MAKDIVSIPNTKYHKLCRLNTRNIFSHSSQVFSKKNEDIWLGGFLQVSLWHIDDQFNVSWRYLFLCAKPTISYNLL